MSAGDIQMRGWQGSPAYKEIRAPVVEYEPIEPTPPQRGRASPVQFQEINLIRKVCRRTLHCLKKDVASVISSLGVDNVTISYDCPTTTGTSTVSYGGGWRLKSWAEPQSATNVYAEVNAVYEKTSVPAFDLGLPAKLTMTVTSGVGTIAYDGTALMTFNTGQTDNGLGWGFDPFVAWTVSRWWPPSSPGLPQAPPPVAIYGISVTCNGYPVTTVIPKYEDFSLTQKWVESAVVASFREGFPKVSFASAGTFDDPESLGIWTIVRDEEYIEKAQKFVDEANSKVADEDTRYGLKGGDVWIYTYTDGYGRSYSVPCKFLDAVKYKKGYYIHGTPAPKLRWDTTSTAGHYKLKWYDNVTIWDWKVT